MEKFIELFLTKKMGESKIVSQVKTGSEKEQVIYLQGHLYKRKFHNLCGSGG